MDYLEYHFRVIDHKITISNLNNKKRGRKKGYSHNTETKNKIADKMKNRVKSDEERDKISRKLKGRKKAQETIKKISKQRRENWPAEDLLKDYTNPSRKEDQEWMSKAMNTEEAAEIKQWILDHYDEYNDLAEDYIKTYKDLRANAMKEPSDSFYQDNSSNRGD